MTRIPRGVGGGPMESLDLLIRGNWEQIKCKSTAESPNFGSVYIVDVGRFSLEDICMGLPNAGLDSHIPFSLQYTLVFQV